MTCVFAVKVCVYFQRCFESGRNVKVNKFIYYLNCRELYNFVEDYS